MSAAGIRFEVPTLNTNALLPLSLHAHRGGSLLGKLPKRMHRTMSWQIQFQLGDASHAERILRARGQLR